MRSTSLSNKKKYVIFACLFCIAIIAALLYYYEKDSKNNVKNPTSNTLEVGKEIKDSAKIHLKESLDKTDSATSQESMKTETKLKRALMPNKENISRQNKPKVAIIIDDLANEHDIRRFESLQLKLTPSLFPKQPFSKNNPKIAKTLHFYMIHLPLEAHNFEQQNVLTLHVGDSLQTIQAYIAQIKRDFPNIRYINNHTGSLYTESMQDMQRLLQVLDGQGITFVDSLTTSKSVAGELARQRNKIYLVRNVFLDNEPNIQAVSKQLESALKIANKQGYVIAIGHPKNATYQTLKLYKEKLLRDYDMIYINELDGFLHKTLANNSYNKLH